MRQTSIFKFRLYVADNLLNSAKAHKKLAALCQTYLAGRHEIEIVDALSEPQRALKDGISMTPTLIRLWPRPSLTTVGAIHQTQVAAEVLGVDDAGSVTSEPALPAVDNRREIEALIETLHETEGRLETLTAGEVDTVSNRAGRVLMLRRAQEHLRHTEVSRHATVLNALPAHIAMLDSHGRIAAVNDDWRRFAQANGMQGDSFGVGLNYLEICDAVTGGCSSEARPVAAGIRSVLCGERNSYSIEYPCHSPSEQRWFLATVTPLSDDLVGCAVVTHIDVTQRKRGEMEQRVVRQLLDNIVDNIPTAVHLKSINDGFRIRLWNKAAEAMYGMPRADAIGHNVHELWPADDADRMDASDLELVARGGMQEFSDRAVPTRGQGTIRAHMRKVVLRDVGGLATHVLVVADDITSRVAQQALLRESERRFSDLLRNVELAAVMLDREAHITYCNPHLLRITGWQQEEVIGQDWFELFMPAELGDMKPVFAALLADLPEAWHVEQEIYTRTRARRLIRWNNSVLRAGTGEVIGTASIGEDITEQTRAGIRIKRLNRVYAMQSGINSLQVRVEDRDELFREACRIAIEDGGFSMAWVGMLDPDKLKIDLLASAGVGEELLTAIRDSLASVQDMQPEYAAVARRLGDKKAVVFNDLQNAPEFGFGAKHLESGVRSMVILPLTVQDEMAGVLALCASEVDYFSEEDLALLRELAGDIAFAVDHIAKKDRLDYLSYYDVLTGLANRSLLLERLAQFLRSAADNGHKLALFMIDVERFKNINDSMGQAAGDALLRQIAEWLTSTVENPSLLARIGADRFAIVRPALEPGDDLEEVIARRLRAFTNHGFRIDDTVVRIAFKAGIAVFPQDGADAETLFRNTEAALKQAKALGERHLFYHRKMTVKVAGKVTLENQLRQALDKGEFVLHYQPKVDVRSGKLTSAEALIRWNDPRTGLVAPGLFIPILEETGLIYEVGRWALRKAVEDNLRWRRAGLNAVSIAVNVSPLQLRNRGFIGEIEQVTGIDPATAAGLELEITESLIMEDVRHSIDSLKRIRALGVRIAIDDFGTGFSSLSYLARLPADSLKIDQSFVRDMTASPQGLALVSTIIDLGHALNLKVVAEGVETEEHARLLRLLQCDEMQGYLVSRPLPADAFEVGFLTPAVVRPAHASPPDGVMDF